MFNLQGKVALVTGSSGSLGQVIAVELARAGADVACHYHGNEDAANRLAGEIRKLGVKSTILQADLTDQDESDRVVQETIDGLGGFDILVNNAGVNREALLIRQKPELVNEILQDNLASMLHMSRAAARRMAKNRWGRLIHMGSVVAHTGSTAQVAYAASKAGIEGMSRAIAREMGGRNITSNVVAPGFISTGMSEHMSEERQKELLSYIALGRTGEPIEVAAAVVFLASEEAGYITGSVLHVNGGMHMQ